MRRHLGATRAWLETAERALHNKLAVPGQPAAPPVLPVGHAQAIGTYQGMIHPLVPYAIRGFLWYQGESNVGEGMLYTLKMEALIKGWRQQFGVADAPFLFVQLAPYNYGGERDGALQAFWVAQQQALKIPHTGMAVTMDIGNPADIHPRNKSEVGRRLALWALADTYGKPGIVKSGPVFESFEVAGDAIRVRLGSAPTGLVTRDGKPPTHFEVAGPDWNFKPATAEISGNDPVVTLRSAEVPQPVMARFAWHQAAEPNLANREGLPATAFHTHWPVDPDLGSNFARDCKWESSDKNTYGWDTGLTDGSWASFNPNSYATGNSDTFPKHVTIDLKQPQTINLIRLGAPEFGSTKTVAVSLSTDGKTFREVGKHAFPLAKAERAALSFPDAEARYIRLTYLDHHAQQAGNFPNTFAFTTEVEAYRVR
jgi:sialate O-acetylesterase